MPDQRPRITKLRAKNFRSLKDVELSLESLTVLVGRNAAGKSNVVDALRFVSDCASLGLDNAVTARHGIGALRRWSAKGRPYDVEIGLEVEGKDWSFKYEFILGGEAHSQYRVKHELAAVKGTGQQAWNPLFERRDDDIQAPGLPPEIRQQLKTLEATSLLFAGRGIPWFFFWDTGLKGARGAYQAHHHLTNIASYHIFPNILREPQKPSSAERLAEHGENLASVLREMIRRNDKLLPDLREALGKVVPGVTDFQVTLVGGYLVVKLKHSRAGSNGKAALFDLSQESDGTLRLLGLLVALFQRPTPSLVTIEEPELTIHPGALAVLADILQEATRRTQVLVTTHSPELIDRSPIEALRVVESDDGVTTLGPIAQSQRDAVRRGLFSAGELHRMEGLQLAGTKS